MKRREHGEVQSQALNCNCLLLVMTAGKLSLWIQLFEEGRSAVCSGHRDKRDS
jgi:hypothetical protein